MGKIKILDESVSNIIAAGEVVENPASMIKEMIENSLDANATMIKIEVFKGGLDVKVSDNGVGMDKDDTLLSIERHATSKIITKDDVFNLKTYGFRGEALASIAAVSKLTITTKTASSPIGYKIRSYGGVVRGFEEISKNVGTEIEIRDLFYNTPARKKFLRKQSTEYAKIRDIVLREALVNSDVAISLELDGKTSIKTSGKGIENAILELFGKSVLRNLTKFKYGYLGNVEILRSSKDYIFTYVNKRYVKSATIERAILDGYYTKLMKGKYPFAIIFFDINPNEIDVNVHPSKKIVKFSNDKIVYRQIKDEIDEFFYYNDRENWQPNIDLSEKSNKNTENVVTDDLFDDKMGKKFISFETYDGKVDNNENLVEENSREEKKSYNENRNENNSQRIDQSNFSTSNSENSIKKEKEGNRKVTENANNNDILENIMNQLNNKKNKVENSENNKNFIKKSVIENDSENFNSENKIFENLDNRNIEKKTDIVLFNEDKKSVSDKTGYKIGTFEKHVGEQIEYNVLGQIFDTYILVKRDNELEIYDQHIIHERILYEELKDKFYNKKIESQRLLLPQKMEVTESEKEMIFENIEIFNDFGFEIDEFSDQEIIFRAIPAFDFRDSIQNVFLKLLEDIKNEAEIKDLRENIIISMSCKGAVKAGQKLDLYEMQNMVRRLHEVGKYTCPHGRPIIVKLTRNDLDKMFGRKK